MAIAIAAAINIPINSLQLCCCCRWWCCRWWCCCTPSSFLLIFTLFCIVITFFDMLRGSSNIVRTFLQVTSLKCENFYRKHGLINAIVCGSRRPIVKWSEYSLCNWLLCPNDVDIEPLVPNVIFNVNDDVRIILLSIKYEYLAEARQWNCYILQ